MYLLLSVQRFNFQFSINSTLRNNRFFFYNGVCKSLFDIQVLRLKSLHSGRPTYAQPPMAALRHLSAVTGGGRGTKIHYICLNNLIKTIHDENLYQFIEYLSVALYMSVSLYNTVVYYYYLLLGTTAI